MRHFPMKVLHVWVEYLLEVCEFQVYGRGGLSTELGVGANR
jgi:hypothetical protein